MSDQVRHPSHASWDAMAEQHMHPFTENDVIEAMERLRESLNTWHALRQSGDDDGTALSGSGRDVLYAIGDAVLVCRATVKRRTRELRREYRVLAKPAKHRE